MRLRTYFLILIVTLVPAAAVRAQNSPDSLVTMTVPGGAMQARAGMVSMRVSDMDAAPVKGAPFCATIATEHTQPFADGNRIHTTDNSTLCRDSEGRIRREASLNLLGAGPQTPTTKLISIIDPVAGERYLLDSDRKIAHRSAFSAGNTTAAGPSTIGAARLSAKDGPVMIYGSAGGTGTNVFFNRVLVKGQGGDSDGPPPATENLGDQTIDGIHATGTRMTTTIPAGKMGNEKPIVVTSERWYSPELQATIMTKHNDPWAGGLKTEFTNVNTSEPDPSLFTVPSDYKIVDDAQGPRQMPLSLPPAAPAQ